MSFHYPNVDDLGPADIEPGSFVIFGGTFDPFHAGHVNAVEQLLRLFPAVVVAPSTQNPWKTLAPTAHSLRLQMISLILAYERVPIASSIADEGVFVSNAGYIYAVDFLKAVITKRPGKAYWAVGEDLAGEVPNWKDWQALGAPVVVVHERIPVHAAELRSGTKPIHPAIKDFVERHGLYQQSPLP